MNTLQQSIIVTNYIQKQNMSSLSVGYSNKSMCSPKYSVEKDREVTGYDLTLNIEPNLDRMNLVTTVTRCGNSTNAEYIVEFTNPGGYFKKQFSCHDQGIYQIHLLLLLCCLLAIPQFYKAWHAMERRQTSNAVSSTFFLSALLFLIHVFLMTVHIAVYSMDGYGLSVFRFSSHIALAMSCTMLITVLLSLSKGLTVSEKRLATNDLSLISRISIFCGVAAMIYSLQETTTANADPFSKLRLCWGSFLLLVSRCVAAVFCYNWSTQSVNRSRDEQKVKIYKTICFWGTLWLSLLPIMVIILPRPLYRWWDVVYVLVPQVGLLCILSVFYSPEVCGLIFDEVSASADLHPYSEMK
eukprot:GHVL01002780.1.p1 GENE.GHVL01002780.1~~GHVL01002780.1.p1  ORF type:complete len:354 (-),score=21.06 GHVL01002780.1:340-1401(-)